MGQFNVGYFVGSLSSTSINRTLSQALIKLAPPEFVFSEIPIGNLPLYSPDFDSDYPPAAQSLKDALAYTESGEVTDEATAGFLRNFMAEFHTHVERVLTVIPRP
ncbi:MAG: hypothetical protein ABIQ39_14155 [Ilumatobacteraceae bacterium]